jgi:hypothetical protein
MTQKAPRPYRSRRRTRATGLPHLAARLPRDFRSPTAVNGFIGDLIVEFTAGRVDARSAAVLGYLGQLVIQTLPLLRQEGCLNGADRAAAATAAVLRAFKNVPRGVPTPKHSNATNDS